MREPSRLWVGVYGAAFHAVVVVAMMLIAVKNRAEIPGIFVARAAPALVIAGFVVYYLVVGPYVPRRSVKRSVVFFDSAIAMFTEVPLVAVASLFYALFASLPALSAGAGAFGAAFVDLATFSVLWMIGSFFTQILVIGNAAGLVGWLVLKKRADRAAAKAAAEAAAQNPAETTSNP